MRPDDAIDDGLSADGMQHQDQLILNLDASLRVHSRSQFFGWTQGLLQNLIPHRMLFCVLPDGKTNALRVDSFTLHAPESTACCAACIGEGFGQQLMKAWEGRRFRPFVREVGRCENGAESACTREFERGGTTHLFAHGMHDVRGGMASFFVFAGDGNTVAAQQIRMAELAVPFLHSAWMRTQMYANLGSTGEGGSKPATRILTPREREILGWIYSGKSNFEIGVILEISPLTVKNHVQKILRKLNVVNRAQAVGRGLQLRILGS